MPANQPRHCQVCNSGISNEDIVERRAGLVAGVLLCHTCVDKKRQELQAQAHAASHAMAASPTAAGHTAEHVDLGTTQGGVYIPPVHDGERDIADEPVALIDDDGQRVAGSTLIRSFATGSTLAGSHDDARYKRPLAAPTLPAVRVRTFHGKLTEAGVAHMDEQINDWLESNPEIYIKSSTSSIGMFEGKSKEPHVVLTLFY
ncbi:MAG: hypothetical protein H6819_05970 [Phycisphaerales bacterium]|nr:hypothetical protein [Phycisphaerales bacterium]MCB9858632.1 hypothetical protein [Phycisphaerales bacterium]